ncbi:MULTISPECIES: SapB/AmfS family lanthipeptide [Streptomyces]|uniref:SapB/AmfS family lanthipeptide n=1 Tax=Streptomyces lonegramiae TaxID=3075524 RepID=A0ABU2XMB7_9ACTN|nr:SapB/AmfS family lanthipeptide [Streptomyces sp. DSM 41529]MDT0547055.1 SapB/AmfS family lanthipeptide [Streptomyces sp. DSM 41529]
MPQILELQELETSQGHDEDGVEAWSSLSGFACDSNLSLIVC